MLLDYSAQEVIKALRRFSSLRGWPVRITSDPGSQLSSSSGKLESWFEGMKSQLSDLASSMNFNGKLVLRIVPGVRADVNLALSL